MSGGDGFHPEEAQRLPFPSRRQALRPALAGAGTDRPERKCAGRAEEGGEGLGRGWGEKIPHLLPASPPTREAAHRFPGAASERPGPAWGLQSSGLGSDRRRALRAPPPPPRSPAPRPPRPPFKYVTSAFKQFSLLESEAFTRILRPEEEGERASARSGRGTSPPSDALLYGAHARRAAGSRPGLRGANFSAAPAIPGESGQGSTCGCS